MPASSRGSNFVWLPSAILATVVLVPGSAPGQQTEKCFVWKVSSNTTTVYVLGTMHLAHPSLYRLTEEIEDAFASSKALAVEVNSETIDKAKLSGLVTRKATYPKGESLSKSLSKKTMDLLTRFCNKKKLKVEGLERVRPWAVCHALAGLMELPPA